MTLTGDHVTLRLLLPKLLDIVSHHLRGTRFGIKVDPTDGLLSQGDPTYPLTWMDAKVEGWIVTPRRGKAVEINALWYNALCLLAAWLREAGRDQEARALDDHAKQAQQSFNERFWYSAGPYLYDVIDGEDGDDAACRPNQLLAISLRHAILFPERWSPALEVVRQRLLTPLGLRSLDPAHPEYKATYDGDLQARDAAYHREPYGPGSSVRLLMSGSKSTQMTAPGLGPICRNSKLTWMTPVSVPSAKSLTLRCPSHPVAAWLKPGVSPKSCAAG